MSRIIKAEVEIDVEEALSQIDTKDLILALRERNDGKDYLNEWTDEHYKILENLYYALRDKGIDEAIKIANPLLDEKIGRQV